ncbi:serine hydrolase domain-containing protein [Geodermatophilus sabuli]|nr:serine hydrolase domain-containing protein [Geodermatophilus sabuli]MBB3085516.1 CubicO group peptidase (beta-lactamase class C family) [Geodermatophilus sabuli]
MGTGTVESSSIGGFVEAGFEAVRDAFAAAAAQPGGAAFAAYKDGQLVVDLWLGEAAPGRPWQEDTPAVIMSATKGIAALAGHILVDRGLLDLDEPVATYWPEFAAAGKTAVLVRHVFAHTSGVITVPGYVDFMRPDGTGWDQEDEIVRRIAGATPLWEPGTKATYHALTYGWMMDELIRRITGKSVRDVIRDEITTPLGIDISIGAEEGSSLGERRAHVISPPRATEQQPDRFAFEQAFTSPDTPLGQSVLADGTSNVVLELERFMNDGPGITVPLSGTDGISTARDLARMYQLLAQGGELDGVRLLSQEAVQKAGSVQFDGPDEIWGMPTRWALGFQLSGAMGMRFGLADSGFGHPGQGGQYGWADPDRGLSFAFVRSYLGLEFDLAAMDALYEAIR